MELNLIILGTAGAGKTLLTKTFGSWLEERNLRVAYVNLDPGSGSPPYDADFDIRRYFTVERIMSEEGLGPNGAMVRACQLMEERAQEITGKINSLDADVRLIDTPGQMEVFLFYGGPELISFLHGFTICIFLMDARILLQPFGATLVRLLSLCTGLRMGVPTVSILNKSDLVEEEELDELLSSFRDFKGTLSDLTRSLFSLLLQYLPPARVVKVSALTRKGFKELYDLVGETRCACGDLT